MCCGKHLLKSVFYLCLTMYLCLRKQPEFIRKLFYLSTKSCCERDILSSVKFEGRHMRLTEANLLIREIWRSIPNEKNLTDTWRYGGNNKIAQTTQPKNCVATPTWYLKVRIVPFRYVFKLSKCFSPRSKMGLSRPIMPFYLVKSSCSVWSRRFSRPYGSILSSSANSFANEFLSAQINIHGFAIENASLSNFPWPIQNHNSTPTFPFRMWCWHVTPLLRPFIALDTLAVLKTLKGRYCG